MQNFVPLLAFANLMFVVYGCEPYITSDQTVYCEAPLGKCFIVLLYWSSINLSYVLTKWSRKNANKLQTIDMNINC